MTMNDFLTLRTDGGPPTSRVLENVVRQGPMQQGPAPVIKSHHERRTQLS